VTAIPSQRPGRRITGMSAVLLPFDAAGGVDWAAFAAGVERTAAAGLVPAVNMDTGYGPSLDPATRAEVLRVTAAALAGTEAVPGWSFVAGAHVDDPAPAFDPGAHRAALAEVAAAGGVPILFPSAGLAGLPDDEVAGAHAAAAGAVDRMLAFELGRQFHPVGRIWSLATYAAVLEVPQVVGAKHSSLRRGPEWERLAVRDERRPGFLVLTGNDLAIDMVRWGSDYLLGLSTFAPDAFARRDRLWAAGDAGALPRPGARLPPRRRARLVPPRLGRDRPRPPRRTDPARRRGRPGGHPAPAARRRRRGRQRMTARSEVRKHSRPVATKWRRGQWCARRVHQ
jgi:hypothetical protein